MPTGWPSAAGRESPSEDEPGGRGPPRQSSGADAGRALAAFGTTATASSAAVALTLTPEQEEAIEQMLMSAVNKISHPVIHRMRRSYDAGEETEVQAWRDIFGLEE